MGHGLLGYPRGDVSSNRLILSGLSCSDPEGYRSGKKGLSRGKRWGGFAEGGAGGAVHPPIEFPRAPVALQGSPGEGAARAAELKRRAKANPAMIGP